jgi:hypothetical protein
VNNDSQLHHIVTNCPNCGTKLAGNFCQGCGQATHLHVPSAREFLHEFIAHYVALEGKLWKSLALLLFRPGRLTRDYIEGKRARYVEPLRLYLTFSIIFFAMFKLGGVSFGDGTGRPSSTTVQAVEQKAAQRRTPPVRRRRVRRTQKEKRSARARRTRTRPDRTRRAMTRSGRKNLRRRSIRHWARRSRTSLKLPEKERNAALLRALSNYAPYAIFALMPVFAALLKLLYLGSGRRYGEHLLFALHTNAFAFLMLSVLLILPDGIPLSGRPCLSGWCSTCRPRCARCTAGAASSPRCAGSSC